MVQPSVLVLMPFARDFDDLYRNGIRAACEAAGARCRRLDEDIYQGSILQRILSEITKADLIVAEMTGRNANVLYEVGYAHALGKRVVLLTARDEDIPFDLKHFLHIIHGGDIDRLRAELERHVRAYAGEMGNDPGSILRDLKGPWVQHVRGSRRPVSITWIEPDGQNGPEFCGVNFDSNGHPAMKFSSKHLFFDAHQQTLWYIFQFEDVNEPGTLVWGFGSLDVEKRKDASGKQRYVLESGFYRSLAAEAVRRSAVYRRCDQVCAELGLDFEKIDDPAFQSELAKTYGARMAPPPSPPAP